MDVQDVLKVMKASVGKPQVQEKGQRHFWDLFGLMQHIIILYV